MFRFLRLWGLANRALGYIIPPEKVLVIISALLFGALGSCLAGDSQAEAALGHFFKLFC